MNFVLSHAEDFFVRLEADGYIDGKIVVKDNETDQKYSLYKHTESVYALSITMYDIYPVIFSAGYDKLVCIWKFGKSGWECVFTLQTEKPIINMATSHRKELALVFKDGTISTYTFTDTSIAFKQTYNISNATAVTYHPMECNLICSTKDGKIIDLDKNSTTQISTAKINFIAFGDSSLTAICDDSTVKVVADSVVQNIPITLNEKPTRLKWTPMTNQLAVYGKNSSEVWNTVDGSTWRRVNNKII